LIDLIQSYKGIAHAMLFAVPSDRDSFRVGSTVQITTFSILLIRVNCAKVLDFVVTDQYWIPQ